MPSVIDPIREGRETGAVIYDYVALKGDGSPGELQSAPVFTADPPELLDVVVRNPNQGVWEAEFIHKGVAGNAVVQVGAVDGDLGEGVTNIGPFTDTVEVRGELGAETAAFTARPQQAPTTRTSPVPPAAV
ncbi:MAG: hypothetical protein LC776_01390 [Acidobacteria bacterium]|nr:hypothetical protein [Acidobacteriota bacterium]